MVNATHLPQPTPRRWISGVEPPAELLAANGTQVLEFECREQPRKLAALIEAYTTNADVRGTMGRLRAIAKADDRPVLFVGMGASFCSAISGSVFLQTHGRPSFAVDAGEWLHYGAPVATEAALSVLLTTSGESAELVELLKGSDRQTSALICNNPASTCWGMSSNALPILAGPEYGNATKSYTNATAAAIITASELLGLPWLAGAETALRVFTSNLDSIFKIRTSLEAFARGAANTEIIGRGAAFGGAFMSALCIREMTGHRAAPHTGAGFKHGPNLDVNGTHLAIVFALGRTSKLGVKLAQECNRRGGKVILVSECEHEATDQLLPVRIDPVPEPWEGITSLLVPQALTLAMTERDGCRLPPRFEYGVMEQ